MDFIMIANTKVCLGDIIRHSTVANCSFSVTKITDTNIELTTGDSKYDILIADLEARMADGLYKLYKPVTESKIKRYVVTAVDSGDSCDGKARVLGTFKTREEAKNYVTEDIKEWADERAGDAVEVDFDKKSAHYIDDKWDTDTGCEWNIEEVEIEL